jgi:hypothetical protein
MEIGILELKNYWICWRNLWKKIVNKERPNANNYQHRVTLKAHMQAREMDNFVDSVEFGKFQVKSSSGEKVYIVLYNELCDEDCRMMYCDECKICIHRYICECPEFSVKNALCKHIHAVALYERRSESISALLNTEEEKNSEEDLCIEEPSTSKMNYQNELHQYLDEASKNKGNELISSERTKEIVLADFVNWAKNLEGEAFDNVKEIIIKCKKNFEKETNNNQLCRKRKIEKQLYYPNKK